MNKNNGFTLIEVLIAMLVLAVGLLGLAGIEATGLGNNQSAYNRSLATQLAYDLADRIRANSSEIATYTTVAASAAKEVVNCTKIAGCTTSEMAENDLYQWHKAVTESLPGVNEAKIEANAAAAGVYKITIQWDDDRDGLDGNNISFETSFQL
ncbi:MAG: type IV pilus modification protein PilV [Methylococcales bacterium]|nr:type IV pilus modification protein PilV [Methylococcaceae bacterium]